MTTAFAPDEGIKRRLTCAFRSHGEQPRGAFRGSDSTRPIRPAGHCCIEPSPRSLTARLPARSTFCAHPTGTKQTKPYCVGRRRGSCESRSPRAAGEFAELEAADRSMQQTAANATEPINAAFNDRSGRRSVEVMLPAEPDQALGSLF